MIEVGILSALWLAALGVVAQQVDGEPPLSREAWSLQGIYEASTEELAVWALGRVPEGLAAHRVRRQGSIYIPGLEFRTRPISLGSACRVQSFLVFGREPMAYLGMSADHAATLDHMSLAERYPMQTVYVPQLEDGGCDIWGLGFQASSDEAATRGIAAWTNVQDAVRSGEAAIRCDDTIEDCPAVFEGLRKEAIREAVGCAEVSVCGSFRFDGGGSSWWVTAGVGQGGPLVTIRRGPPPISA